MLETYRVPSVRFALAVMLGLARHDDRGPAELVPGDVDRQPVPLEPRMRVTPTVDIVRRILIDVIGGDPQPLDQVAAKQLRGMSAGSPWVCDVLQCPRFGSGCIDSRSEIPSSLLDFGICGGIVTTSRMIADRLMSARLRRYIYLLRMYVRRVLTVFQLIPS
jgi:hypothetical protein